MVPVAANALQPSAQVAARWLPPPPPADAPMSAPATTVMEKSTLPLSRGGDSTISNQPQMVKTITILTRPAQSASLAPMPELVPVAAPTPQPSAKVAMRSVPPADQSGNVVASSAIAQTPLAKRESKKIEAVARVELAKVERVTAPVKAHIAASSSYAHGGWLIQIGAFDHEDEAKQHLSMAQSFRNFTTGNSHSFGGEYIELVPHERLRYTDKFDDPNLPGQIQVTVTLKKVSLGTELNIVQEGLPDAIPPEACYLGWQESLRNLAKLVEPEINQ